MAAKMVMERWTNYGGEDGDGAKLQVKYVRKVRKGTLVIIHLCNRSIGVNAVK